MEAFVQRVQDPSEQRVGTRREARHKLALPIRLVISTEEKRCYANSITYDISFSGMRIHSVPGLALGAQVGVERKGRRGLYNVVWSGTEKGKNLLGLQAVDSSVCIWEEEVLRTLAKALQLGYKYVDSRES